MKNSRIIKWPAWVMLIRHDVSAYNALKDRRMQDPRYLRFLNSFNKDPSSLATQLLARQIAEWLPLGMGDADTPLADVEGRRACTVGRRLRKGELPDIIFVSPYLRTRLTLEHLTRGWPELAQVKVVEEERIREQEHGLATIYNDWRVFHTLHPEQRRLFELEGPYWYRYPQGENKSDVRERNRSWTTTLTRDFAGKRILVITHHLNILAMRANFERWGAEQFIHVDEHDKPVNCGVTLYRCHPRLGANGRLKLAYYNRKLYR